MITELVPGQRRGPVHLVFQEELLRGMDPSPAVAAAGAVPHVFSAQEDWRSVLDKLDRELGAISPMDPMSAKRVACFCSLQIAAHIRRSCGHLVHGILQDEDRLAAHCFLGVLPSEWLLNRDAIMMPFGRVEERAEQLETLFGPRLFMRPDSSRKAFSGTTFGIEDIGLEISAQRQIHNVHDDTLVMIDRARAIRPHEYRFWIADRQVLTWAPYAFEAGSIAPPCPAEIFELARQVADRIEIWANPVVADFVLDETGQARLVELNGFSTSGFYEGVDFGAMARGLDLVMY